MTPFLTPLLLAAAVVNPPQVPAQGPSEAIVTLDEAAMVRIESTGPTGLSCEIVDHVRGPFATAGEPGKSACRLELLLDAGTYKLRLKGPAKAKAKAKAGLQVTPFAETQKPVVKLENGRPLDTQLKPGQQASFWVHVDSGQALNVRVAGRTAGRIALWRDGTWLEDFTATDLRPAPRAGQPIHEWWVSVPAEAGDYKLVAYGTDPIRWTNGAESDALRVVSGFEDAAPTRAATITLPPFGSTVVMLPRAPAFAYATLAGPPEAPLDVSLLPLSSNGVVSINPAGRCRIAQKQLDPRCVAKGSGQVLIVRGTPGTSVDLMWGGLAGSRAEDGDFGLGDAVYFEPGASAEHLVGLTEAPADEDAGPLGCVLEKTLPYGAPQYVGGDFVEIGPKKPLVRAYNSTGQRETIWFRVTSAMKLAVETDPSRHARCELFTLDSGRPGKRLSDSKPDLGCNLSVSVNPGDYQLDLYGGNRGIQKLKLSDGSAGNDPTATKAGCLLRTNLDASAVYLIRTNRSAGRSERGLALRPLPDGLDGAATLSIDPGREVRIPVLRSNMVDVKSAGGVPFQCGIGSDVTEASNGRCSKNLKAKDTLVLANKGTRTAVVTLAPTWTPPAGKQPAAYNPTPRPLQTLAPDSPLRFDLDRSQMQSMLFDVAEAGLYDVTTQGLLATSCTVRTPVVTRVASDTSGGRGRNCLVAQYLRPGKYLLTVQTTGQSKGRLAVVLAKRPIRPGPPVAAGSEAFFRAEAGELVQQRLSILKPGPYSIETTARGIPLSCRLDDPDGWPVVKLPANCALQQTLRAGEYLWTQLPPTVESLRHTQVEAVKPPVLFTGSKVHPITLHTWHDAQLDKDGKDEWFLNLEADLDVTFALTNRMQGRLYRIDPADKSLKVVDVIPPTVEAAPPPEPAYSEEGEAPPEPVYEGDGESEEMATDEEAPSEETPAYVPPPPPAPAAPAAMPGGKTIHLPPGPYKLITEHSQGDVAVRYRLFVGSDVLTPGTSRETAVPSTVTVRMPKDGTLRVRTTGEADVRCRLTDPNGKLIAEALDNGDDWNCAFAEPLAAGDYTLTIASQTQTGGTTRVSVSLPPVEDAGALADGKVLKLGAGVVFAQVPPVTGDVVQEVSFAADSAFSCALEDGNGALLGRQLNTKNCDLLLRPQGAYRVRLWTLDRPAEVKTLLETKALDSFDGGKLRAGSAGKAEFKRAGRYVTGPDTWCLPESQKGPMRWCSPEVSLEAGSVIFARARRLGDGEVSLKENALVDDAPQHERLNLTRRTAIQAQVSADDAVHLFAARTPVGERAAPTCAFTEGARAMTESGCFAASRVGERAIAKWSAPSDVPAETEVTRVAAILDEKGPALMPGRLTLKWKKRTVRYPLPSGPTRLEFLLPAETWAVILDKDGRALDLCAPAKEMARCELGANGGELVVYSPDASEAVVTVTTGAPAPAPVALGNVFEDVSPTPGSLAFTVAAAEAERTIDVAGANRCVVTLPDGLRSIGCHATVPARSTATLELDEEGSPLRIVVGSSEQERLGFGSLPSAGPESGQGQAIALSGSGSDRSLVVKEDGVLHLRGDSGVCALAQKETVLAVSATGARCAVDRLVTAGTYHLAVRPFGKQPLSGVVSWTWEPVTSITEGVGPEAWLGPTETRLFRFTVAAAGRIGLGVQVGAETFDCSVHDASQRLLATGCQQYLDLDPGAYLFAIHAPRDVAPQKLRPVVFGLAGANRDVPEEYLRDFFQRIEAAP